MLSTIHCGHYNYHIVYAKKVLTTFDNGVVKTFSSVVKFDNVVVTTLSNVVKVDNV
jgi:hypothetical protein